MDEQVSPENAHEKNNTEHRMRENARHILATALSVIQSPRAFYHSLVTTGGFTEPLVFLVVLSVATGLVKALVSLFTTGLAASLFLVCGSIVIAPLSAVIFGFIGAGALYIIWKILGSNQSFECAFRCAAYAAAISPVAEIISVVPYIGPVVGIAWFMTLMALASVEIHHVQTKLAWGVFGVLAGILCVNTLMAQVTTRSMMHTMSRVQKEISQLSPEEAGKAVASFLQGFETATQDTKSTTEASNA